MDPHLRPAVFLDRDGTIIEDRGHLRSPAEVVFIPAAMEALRRLQARFVLVIVTNQSGVAAGLLSREEVEGVNAFVVAEMARQGVHVAAVYYCPHLASDGCDCIKPKPYFLHRAAAEHGLDLARSYSVGDHPGDVTLAEQVGGRGIFVLTGHGAKHSHELPGGTMVAADIGEAVELILRGQEQSGPA